MANTSLSLKRKQPGDMPVQPPLPRINVLSDVVVTTAVAKPQGLGAVVNGCSGNQESVDLGSPHHPSPSSLPVLQVSDQDFEVVNPEFMVILEELERMSKCPELNVSPSVPQKICGPEANMSNLGMDGTIHSPQYSIPVVPPLLSPLPPSDDDDVKIDCAPSSSKKSKGSATSNLIGIPQERGNKPPIKKVAGKKSVPILRGALKNRGARCSRTKLENTSKPRNQGGSLNDSEVDCFSQSEIEVIKETAKIYRRAKEVSTKEREAIEKTEEEIKKTKEKLSNLEEKLNRHLRNLDKASRKLRAVEVIFEK